MNHTATGTATVTLTDATVNRPTAGRTSLRIPPVLGPLSVELGTGVVGVVGRNGAGKTTLLRSIAGQVVTDGEITIGGEPVRDNQRVSPLEWWGLGAGLWADSGVLARQGGGPSRSGQ